MKILIVDDNAAVRTTLKLVLGGEFEEVAAVGDPTLLPAILSRGNVDAVLLDMNFDNRKLDGSDGLFWLERIKSMAQAPAVVLITAFGDVPLAVEAMKRGAEDFVTKPWENGELIEKLRKAISKNRRLRDDGRRLDKAKELEKRAEEQGRMTLDEMKRKHIQATIEKCGGNLTAAAEHLGVNRQTLYNILKRE